MEQNKERSTSICLATYNDRLASLFDTAACLQMCRFDPQGLLMQGRIQLPPGDPLVRVRTILESGAEILICGAISKCLERVLTEAGMEVHPWIRGSIQDVLSAFTEKKLDRLAMPGCGCSRFASKPIRTLGKSRHA